MPYPQNLETALLVEAEVRKGGAVPATIAVIAGVPYVGECAWRRSLLSYIISDRPLGHCTDRC